MSQLIPVAFLAIIFTMITQLLPDELGEDRSTHHCDPWCGVALEPIRADYDPLRVAVGNTAEETRVPVAEPVPQPATLPDGPAPALAAIVAAAEVAPRALIVEEPTRARIPRAVVVEEPASFASLAH